MLCGEEYAHRHRIFYVTWMADRLLCQVLTSPRSRHFRKRQDDVSVCLHPEFLQYTGCAPIGDKAGIAKLSSTAMNILSDASSRQAERAAFRGRPWAGQGISLHR